jgi:hypothetical protein
MNQPDRESIHLTRRHLNALEYFAQPEILAIFVTLASTIVATILVTIGQLQLAIAAGLAIIALACIVVSFVKLRSIQLLAIWTIIVPF